MIAGLKPHAQYRDSGLPWLGQVPAHWRVVRNGSLFGQRSQTGFDELPVLEVSLKTGVQVRAFGSAKRKQVMSDFAKYKRAAQGDLPADEPGADVAGQLAGRLRRSGDQTTSAAGANKTRR